MSQRPGPGEHAERYNRDNELKTPAEPGKPPRPSTEPDHAEGSARNSQTATDPATGETNPESEKKA